MGFPCSSVSKESACSAGDLGLIPGLGRSPGRSKCQPTPVSLPGKSHGQRSLVGCSPWGHKESGMTERLTLTQEGVGLEGVASSVHVLVQTPENVDQFSLKAMCPLT